MNDSVMANGYIISNNGFCFLESGMYNRAILNIYFIAEADAVYVTSYHCTKPYAAIITHHHIANDSGIGSNKTIFAKLRMFIFNRENNCHRKNL